MDRVVLGKTELPVLVAITEDEQVQGLMYKSWPPPVMAFPFDRPSVRKFWMRNTISPLDIIFCKANKVVSIEEGIPLSLKLVGPDEPVDLVVELPKGTSKKLGILVGDFVDIKYSIQTLSKKYTKKLGSI